MGHDADIASLPALIAAVYEAALDPSLWDQVMARARNCVEESLQGDARVVARMQDSDPKLWWANFAVNPPNELSRQFLPYLDRAYKLRLETLRLRTACEAGLSALDMLPIGIALLAPDRKAFFCNRAARNVAMQRDGVQLDANQRFVASSPRDDAVLQRHIGDAIRANGSRQHAGVMRLDRRTGCAPLCVLVVTPNPAQWGPAGGPSAILFISDPDAKPGDVERFLTAVHGLTPAEARMAAALITGQTLSQYAMTRGITRNTARTQLRQVLAKTGAQRQSDLMRIVLTSPATIGFNYNFGSLTPF
jgi:DNA-binding CsgD family transcriptional regulator